MSITSKTDICNLALDLLSGGIIEDVENPTSPTESLLARWYDVSRRKILREHPWHFATKRQVLAASSTAPAFEFSTAFPTPNDFIRILRIQTDEGAPIPVDSYQFELNQILINTDAIELRLIYIYDAEDVTTFDTMFIPYFALDLALMIAYKATQSSSVVDRIASLEKTHGAMAKAISGQERPPIRINRSRNRDIRQSEATDYSHRVIF